MAVCAVVLIASYGIGLCIRELRFRRAATVPTQGEVQKTIVTNEEATNPPVRRPMSAEPVPPRESYEEFPVDAEPVVMRALSKNPSSRHQSAIEMLEEIKKLEGYDRRTTSLTRFTAGNREKVYAAGDLGKRLSSEQRHDIASRVLNQLSAGEIPGVTKSSW